MAREGLILSGLVKKYLGPAKRACRNQISKPFYPHKEK